MAIEKVKKIYLTFHKSEKASILEKLQDEGVIHIDEIDSDIKETFKTSEPGEEELEKDLAQKVTSLQNALSILKPYLKQEGFLESLFEKKESISKKDVLDTIKTIDGKQVADDIISLNNDKVYLSTRIQNLHVQRGFLLPWKNMDAPLSSMNREDTNVIFIPGKILERNLNNLKDIAYSEVNRDERLVYIVVGTFKSELPDTLQKLQENEFERVEFHGYKSSASEEIAMIDKETDVLKEEAGALEIKLKEFATYAPKIRILHDYFSNILERSLVDERGVETDSATFLTGWVKESDFDRTKKIINSFDTASMEEVSPDRNEKPPILLRNHREFFPFETLIKLYGLPDYREFDPTPVMAPFFVVFFALCLTDAGYGLALMLISLYLLKKLKGAGKDLFYMLLAGGAVTIIAGAVTGGWFGNIQSLFPALDGFVSKFRLFDPMKTNGTMKFFALSLGFGYLQILFGLLVGAIKKFKNREIIQGISNELAWIVVLVSAAAGAFKNYMLHVSAAPFWYAAVAGLAVILLLSGESKNIIKKFLKGAYNIYGGISLIGDLLSYVRLMALGIVTAGIAMAVNILTALVFQIPIAGFILAPLIFVGGHIFSIFVNTMGAFVHSLRLQYVEFFTKFYDDGGKPFIPFKWNGKYYDILTEKEAA